MPLQNRVCPDGSIVTDAWRGNFMGNRGGKIHYPETKTLSGRKWVSKRWICCVTQFKERQRVVMGNGYTELFFLDEVSALASGHRPCFECRRQDAKRFATFWSLAIATDTPPRADAMDDKLHAERISERSILSRRELDALPDGAMFQSGDAFYTRRNRQLVRWSGKGYMQEKIKPISSGILLTPPAIVSVLRAGYEPKWHSDEVANSNGDT